MRPVEVMRHSGGHETQSKEYTGDGTPKGPHWHLLTKRHSDSMPRGAGGWVGEESERGVGGTRPSPTRRCTCRGRATRRNGRCRATLCAAPPRPPARGGVQQTPHDAADNNRWIGRHRVQPTRKGIGVTDDAADQKRRLRHRKMPENVRRTTSGDSDEIGRSRHQS